MKRARSAPGVLRVQAANSSLAASRELRRRLVPLEHDSQVAVIQWWALACKGYGLPEFALLAIPNGGDRHPAVGAKMKAEGVRKGAPDLLLAVPWEGSGPEGVTFLAAGLWIEMKRRGNSPTEEQHEVILFLRKRRYHAVVAYDSDEAIKAIKAYLMP